MRLERRRLLDALERALPATNVASVIEEEGDFLLADDRVIARSGPLAINTSLGCATGVHGQVNAALLIGIVRGLSGDHVDLTIDEFGHLIIEASGRVYKLAAGFTKEAGREDDDHPVLSKLDWPAPEWEGWRPLPPNLLSAMKLVSFSASTYASDLLLTAVWFFGQDVVSSDGPRISRYRLTDKRYPPTHLLPDHVKTFNRPCYAPTHYADGDGRVFFKNAETILSALLLTGDYPPYEDRLAAAEGLEYSVTFPARTDAVLKRMGKIKLERDQCKLDREISVDIQPGSITFRARMPVEVSERLRSASDGPAFKFTVHPHHLLAALTYFRTARYSPGEEFIAFREGAFSHVLRVGRCPSGPEPAAD